MKKVISILLTVFMLVGMTGLAAYAEDVSEEISFNTLDGEFASNGGSGNYFYNSGKCSWSIAVPENGYYKLTVSGNKVVGSNVTFSFECGAEKISQTFGFEEGEKTTEMTDYIYLEKGNRTVSFTTSQGGTIVGFTLTLMEKATLIKFNATDGTINGGAENGYFYNGGYGTYSVEIPVNGYYRFTVDHALASGAELTVKSGEESVTEKFDGFDSSRKTTTLANDIYLEKGTRTVTFSSSQGGMVYSYVLSLVKKETHIDINASDFVGDHNDQTNGFTVGASDKAWWYCDGKGLSYDLSDLPANGVYKLSVWYKIDAEGNSFTMSSGTESVSNAAGAVTEETKVDFEDGIYLEKGGAAVFTAAKGGTVYKFRLTLVREETRLNKSVSDCVESNNIFDNGYFTDNGYAVYDFTLPSNGKYDVLITYTGTPSATTKETAVTYLNSKYTIPAVAHDGYSAELIVSGLEMYKKDGKIKISGLGNCTVSGVSLILRESMENVSLTKLGYATVSAGIKAGDAGNVIDGNTDTQWLFNVAGTGDTNIYNKWIQINLDAPHEISQIRYLNGKNCTWDMFGKEISVRVSNDPMFRTYKEVAAEAKNGAIPTDGSTYYEISLNGGEAYRYVRFAKCNEGSNNLAMSCAEIDIIGKEEADVKSDIVFSKDGSVITKLTGGSCTAGTVITNNKEADCEYFIIIGLYNEDGIMTKCFRDSVDIAQGESAPISLDFEKESDTVKATCAVFDGYATALMACDSNSITAE